MKFTPLEKKILNMALNNDDKLCSFYAKELFEHINLADVVRKQIRIKKILDRPSQPVARNQFVSGSLLQKARACGSPFCLLET